MTPKTYLNQAYRLEQRIRLDQDEINNLRSLATDVGSPGFDEHYNPNTPTDAPFVRTLDKVMEYETKVDEELNLLLKLKAEIQGVIDAVPNMDERLVLKYRYLKNYTWNRIGDELYADERTVRRWHDRALSHVTVPENPTVI
ncbi:MAG: RNA polymerase subunit sigma-70 [Lachnospiraceae bacterium]|jgi:DNA-directed RNA polymerase specialized sigma subunit|nr:RNA polymerase subunit sigma-70 [Lachnospiraceae bacterium]MCH4067242.1 RNA polymerase subunit sigma-70 [Lachnospiraceae bacterium]MCH4113267.1 RNA polymerase subunit sigma-70 [Lachnospiraceae bacterium]